MTASRHIVLIGLVTNKPYTSDEARAIVNAVRAESVPDAQVLATAVRQARGEKLIVFRYKSKKRFRHRRGHRQELTILSIDDIVANGKSLITGEAPGEKQETPEETEVPTTSETETPDSETPETSAEETGRRRRRTARSPRYD